jgi:hypothetical protein
MERLALFPSEGSRAADIYRPLKGIAPAGFVSVNLGYSGKHANHYSTDAICWCQYSLPEFWN